MNSPKSDITVVFGLETAIYEAETPAPKGKGSDLVAPALSVFLSADIAAKARQGIDIEEGDLCFFAADGSMLGAHFTQKPYVDKDKYFPGVYSLKPAAGEALSKVIAKILAQNAVPHTPIIVYMADDDEDAQWYGWKSAKKMKEDILHALKILPEELQKRVKFE